MIASEIRNTPSAFNALRTSRTVSPSRGLAMLIVVIGNPLPPIRNSDLSPNE